MTLLALLLGLSWPLVHRFVGRVGISEGAEALRQELSRARLRSIDRGIVFEFFVEPGGKRFLVLAQQSEISRAGQGGGASQPAATFDGWTGTLTGDLRFQPQSGGDASARPKPAATSANSPQSSNRAKSLAALPTATTSNEGQRISADRLSGIDGSGTLLMVLWDSPILFYPEGTSDEGELTLTDASGRTANVELRGLTGAARWSLGK